MKNVFDWVRKRLGKTQEVEFILTVRHLMRSWKKILEIEKEQELRN